MPDHFHWRSVVNDFTLSETTFCYRYNVYNVSGDTVGHYTRISDSQSCILSENVSRYVHFLTPQPGQWHSLPVHVAACSRLRGRSSWASERLKFAGAFVDAVAHVNLCLLMMKGWK